MFHRHLWRLCVAGASSIFFLTAVSAQSGQPQLRRLEVDGHTRVYTVEAIGGAGQGKPRPILVELHGLGNDVRENIKSRHHPNFATVTNLEPALIVRPQGAARTWDHIPGHIKDWRRLSGADGVPVDDIAFLRAVLADTTAKDNGDPKRAYLYGISAGGYMTARIACEMADEFRAIANLIATARVDQLEACRKSKPMPYMLLASKSDPVNPYAGLDRGGGSTLVAAEVLVTHFAVRNGCKTVQEAFVPPGDQTTSTTAVRIQHTECTASSEVLFVKLDGTGHNLPSRVRYESDRDNKINRDLETAQELWDFFNRHRGP